jgi:hypothetical protein
LGKRELREYADNCGITIFTICKPVFTHNITINKSVRTIKTTCSTFGGDEMCVFGRPEKKRPLSIPSNRRQEVIRVVLKK